MKYSQLSNIKYKKEEIIFMKFIVEKIKNVFDSNENCSELTKFTVVGIVEFTLFFFAYRLLELLSSMQDIIGTPIFIIALIVIVLIWLYAAIALLDMANDDDLTDEE
jgi:hypothetical protein